MNWLDDRVIYLREIHRTLKLDNDDYLIFLNEVFENLTEYEDHSNNIPSYITYYTYNGIAYIAHDVLNSTVTLCNKLEEILDIMKISEIEKTRLVLSAVRKHYPDWNINMENIK